MTRTLHDLASATMVLPVYGTTVDEATDAQAAANRSIYGVDTAAEVIVRHRPAGLVFVERIPFHRGFEDVDLGMLGDSERFRAFVEGVQQTARSEELEPLLIVADQEGGVVNRIPVSELPAPAVIGRTGSEEVAERAGELTCWAALAHGVGVVLGPLADLGLGNAAIGDRAFSSDPVMAARLASAWVRGVQKQGIRSVVKHWPGHGRATTDSHVSTPSLDIEADVWRAEERTPFDAAVDADVAGVLVAHMRAPTLDPTNMIATQSPVIIDELRSGLGFAGAIMSDALWMPSARTSASNDAEAAIAVLNAGVDLLLAPPDPAATAALAAQKPEMRGRFEAAEQWATAWRSTHPEVDRSIDVDELNNEIEAFTRELG